MEADVSSMERHEEGHRYSVLAAAGLFGAAAIVTVVVLALPHPSQLDVRGVVAIGAVAAAFSVALVLGRDRFPESLNPILGLIGTALVSFGLWFSGERHGGPPVGDETYYLWIVLWAAFYFPRRALAVQVISIVVAYGITLRAMSEGSVLSRWIMLSGFVIGAAVVVRLLSERIEQLIRELRASASSDPLTGLVNRRGLGAAYARELAQHRRTGRPFALLVADLDRFKEINDELGHKAGDRALVEVAGLLLAQVRAVDTAARIGGDEFALLLSEADAVHAAAVAERLDAAVAAHAARERWPGSISIGVSVSNADGESLDDLLRHADSRLYLAKRRSARDRTELDAAA
jgi:diguanylate cyclase (GGDEF)-like protein